MGAVTAVSQTNTNAWSGTGRFLGSSTPGVNRSIVWRVNAATPYVPSSGAVNPPFGNREVSAGFANISLQFAPASTGWTGVVDDNWHDPANWSNGVPDATTNVVVGAVTNNPVITTTAATADLEISAGGVLTIASGGQLDVTGELTNSEGNSGLVIKSDDTGTGSLIHNSADVPATVERYFATAETWRLVSSPVVNQGVSDNWTPVTGDYGYDFYAYDEENEMWLNQKEEANNIIHFVPGKGYLVSFESVEYTTPTFVDDLNNGDITIEVTRDSEGDYAGANLIGNPYASAIDWSEADRTLFEDDFAYVYDASASGGAGAYQEIDGSDEIGDSFIAPHQGFFVIKEAEIRSNFTFTNAMRVHGGTFTKQQQMQEALELRLAGDTYYDQTTLRIRENSAFERDRQDARKFFSYNQQAPQLYSYTSDNIQVSINSIPAINEYAATRLGMRIPADGVYTLRLAEMTGAFGEQDVYLKDNELGIEQNLSEVAVYDFSASAGDLENRFLIHFGALSLDDNRAVTTANAYMLDNTLYILNARGETHTEVFDLHGRLMHSRQFMADGLYSQPLNLPAGVYVVRIMDAEGVSSTKIIVK